MATITDLNSSDSGSTSLSTINTNFDNLNTDKAEISGQTFTGKVNFSGTDHAGIELISLTTAERDALTPVNGDLIYNETTSKVQMYQGGAWTDVTSVAADADTSTKGVVEVATDAEIEAGTGTGGTGAVLVVPADSSHLPDDNEMAALAGTSGTPSGSNKFVTNDDVSDSAGSGKIVRASGTALPALDGSNLTNIANDQGFQASFATPVSQPSSTSETTLISYSLGGGQLGTNKVVRAKIYFEDMDVAAGRDLTIRLKYGSTTVATNTVTLNTNNLSGYIETVLIGAGTTSSQKGVVEYRASTDAGTAESKVAVGTSSEDSTGGLTYAVTVQWSAGPGAATSYEAGYIELIA
jgi:hypothetical protein